MHEAPNYSIVYFFSCLSSAITDAVVQYNYSLELQKRMLYVVPDSVCLSGTFFTSQLQKLKVSASATVCQGHP